MGNIPRKNNNAKRVLELSSEHRSDGEHARIDPTAKREATMQAKAAARERFDSARDELIALSHRIHANPELGFEEEKASTWLCGALDEAGFSVEKGICDLPTAFRARAGSGPLHIAICAEYDCLPDIGHACGHNIIRLPPWVQPWPPQRLRMTWD